MCETDINSNIGVGIALTNIYKPYYVLIFEFQIDKSYF